MRSFFASLLAASLIIAGICQFAGGDDGVVDRRLRGPVALGFLGESQIACVANQKSGTVSLVDLERGHVIAETHVGASLSDLAVCRQQRSILVVDSLKDQLVAVSYREHELEMQQQLQVDRHPVCVVTTANGEQAFVSCLWSHSVMQVQLETVDGRLRMAIRRRIELPFAPRDLLVLPSAGKLVVADAFGGRLAVVDIHLGAVESVRKIPGHNLRGLTLNPAGDRILVAQQVLNPLAPTTRDNIIWSVLMTNCLRSLSVTQMLDPSADLMRASRFIPLGTVGRGGGDPADLAVDASGRTFVCLAGVHQVALLSPDGRLEERFVTGRRPMAMAAEPEGRGYLIANHFSDSLTWIPASVQVTADGQTNVNEKQPDAYSKSKPLTIHADVVEIALGSSPELTIAQLGEQLFYDATLSHDNWMSCHSCHTDGHTNGELADTLGDGGYGAPKQIPTLLGVARTGPWAWDGSAGQLREQIKESLVTSMQGPRPTERQLDALQAFMEGLRPAPARLTVNLSRLRQAQKLFEQRGCRQCHKGDRFTSDQTFDVGLRDENGQAHFNPPSLLGVGQRMRWLHDGRAKSLTHVIDGKFRHPPEIQLMPEEVELLVDYLESL